MELDVFCKLHRFDARRLTDVLQDQKVFPFVQGVYQEKDVIEIVGSILGDRYRVFKDASYSASYQQADEDCTVECIQTFAKWVLESKSIKTAKKSSVRYRSGCYTISVKCHRSRSKRDDKVFDFAKSRNIDSALVDAHHDAYYEPDHPNTFVIISLRNLGYRTVDEARIFAPTSEELDFLARFAPCADRQTLFKIASRTFFVARMKDMAPNNNGIGCSCHRCPAPSDCCFIPRTLSIRFRNDNTIPEYPWFPVSDLPGLLSNQRTQHCLNTKVTRRHSELFLV